MDAGPPIHSYAPLSATGSRAGIQEGLGSPLDTAVLDVRQSSPELCVRSHHPPCNLEGYAGYLARALCLGLC